MAESLASKLKYTEGSLSIDTGIKLMKRKLSRLKFSPTAFIQMSDGTCDMVLH